MGTLRRGFVSALAMLLGLLTAATWLPFLAQPAQTRTLLLGIAFAAWATGLLTRSRLPWAAVATAQFAVGLVWIQWRLRDLGPLWRTARDGALAINTHTAPIPAEYVAASAYLGCCALTLMVCIDVLTLGWRRPAVTALPVLLGLTVPISTLEQDVGRPLLVAVVCCFAALLLAHGWRTTAGADSRRAQAGVLAATAVIVSLSVLGGLTLADTTPTGPGLSALKGRDRGVGPVRVTDPIVEIRRGLVNQSHLQLLSVHTDDPDPHHIRLAVLDRFDGERWSPSPRQLSVENRLGPQMRPPGLSQGKQTRDYVWRLRYTDVFDSPWLAVPYPFVEVDTGGGDYRVDPDTFDIFDVSHRKGTAAQLGYEARGVRLDVRATDLDSAGAPPLEVSESMTALPENTPRRILTIAEAVVGQADTDYQKVAALQRWFRKDGNFGYSLWEGSHESGLPALERFLTTEKVGYCEQFAAAMAVLSRSLGIPARVAVGFGRPSSAAADSWYTFTGKTMHAWTEVYFSGFGWVTFDPTPAVQSGPAPSYSLGLSRSAEPEPRATRSTEAQPKPRPVAPEKTKPVTTTDSGRTPWWPWLVLALAVAPMATPSLVRRRQRHARREALLGSEAVAAAAALWAELRAIVIDHGHSWPAGLSPRMTGASLQRDLELGPASSQALASLCAAVERARYSRSVEWARAEREQFASWLDEVTAAVRAERGRAQRLRANMLPRSVWRRRSQ